MHRSKIKQALQRHGLFRYECQTIITHRFAVLYSSSNLFVSMCHQRSFKTKNEKGPTSFLKFQTIPVYTFTYSSPKRDAKHIKSLFKFQTLHCISSLSATVTDHVNIGNAALHRKPQHNFTTFKSVIHQSLKT
jgi:hypothetical protein